ASRARSRAIGSERRSSMMRGRGNSATGFRLVTARPRLSGVNDEVAGFENDRRRRCIEADAERILAAAHGIDLAVQQATQQQDALVAGGEMLVGMEGDGALSDLRLPV